MANCKIINSIAKSCEYNIAGVRKLYLFNFDAAVTYTTDADGVVTAITLPTSEKIYKFDFADDSASFTDALTAGSNGAKYRVPTVVFTLNGISVDILKQTDALSLGTFTAIVVDKNGKSILLGSDNGLNATTDDYASGAAAADASGWVVTLVGAEHSTIKLIEDEDVFKGLVDMTIVP